MSSTKALPPIAWVAPDRLTLLPGNPRSGDIEAISRSIQEFGFLVPVVVNSDGLVIAGNHRVAAARQLGLDAVPVWRSEQFDDSTRAKAFALADNRTNDLAGYNDRNLAAMLEDVLAADADLLAAASFTEDDLAELLDTIHRSDMDALEETDGPEIGVIPDDPVTNTGDVWLLGEHRVMCGDSADPAAVFLLTRGEEAAAMVTDPPYGINYGEVVDWRNRMRRSTRGDGHIQNDETDDAIDLWGRVFPVWKNVLRAKDSAFYCWGPGGPQQIDLGEALRVAGLAPHGSIIWRKSSFSFSRADHKYQHEPCWYGWRSDGTHRWAGPNNETSVWDFDRPARSDDHPTQKPLGLIQRCIRNITHKGEIVVDPFLGSGTTLLASDIDGRVCFGMELDPRYVDVICRRWQTLTGQQPVLEATGEPHGFEGA